MPPPAPTDLAALATRLTAHGPVKTYSCTRRIRVVFAGVTIADTCEALYVWEHPGYPFYYLPTTALLVPSAPGSAYGPSATQLVLSVGERTLDRTIAFTTDPASPAGALNGLVKIDFSAADLWLEEDTPIHIHPKDPFKRIDVVFSKRPLRVSLNSTTLAASAACYHLYETGLPTRYYLPLTDLDLSLLQKSATRTHCPYKGEAEYYSVEIDGTVVEDVFWFYRHPLPEVGQIAGLCGVYAEKVDVEVDGQRVERLQMRGPVGGK